MVQGSEVRVYFSSEPLIGELLREVIENIVISADFAQETLNPELWSFERNRLKLLRAFR